MGPGPHPGRHGLWRQSPAAHYIPGNKLVVPLLLNTYSGLHVVQLNFSHNVVSRLPAHLAEDRSRLHPARPVRDLCQGHCQQFRLLPPP